MDPGHGNKEQSSEVTGASRDWQITLEDCAVIKPEFLNDVGKESLTSFLEDGDSKSNIKTEICMPCLEEEPIDMNASCFHQVIKIEPAVKTEFEKSPQQKRNVETLFEDSTGIIMEGTALKCEPRNEGLDIDIRCYKSPSSSQEKSSSEKNLIHEEKQPITSEFILESDMLNTAEEKLFDVISSELLLANNISTKTESFDPDLSDMSQILVKEEISHIPKEYQNCFVKLEKLNMQKTNEMKSKNNQRKIPYFAPAYGPAGLSIVQTSAGVMSVEFIPKGTKFGPFPANAQSKDNWMSSMTVLYGKRNCNVRAKKSEAHVYYKTTKDIQPNTQLILLADKNEPVKGHYISKYKCEKCGKCSKSRKGLQLHLKYAHAKTKPHGCQICGKWYSRLSEYKYHMLVHSSPQQHICKICGKICTNKILLRRHMVGHSDVKPHKCPQCHKSFHFKSLLRKHEMSSHFGFKCYKCSLCGQQFTSNGNLKRHIANHGKIRTHKCELCPVSFMTMKELHSHQLASCKNKLHQCPICNRSFLYEKILHAHLSIHSQKVYRCTPCSRDFRFKNNLERHIQEKHVDQPPLQCQECGKTFNQKSNLTIHMLSHTDHQAYGCQTCGKHFKHKHTLVQHILTHTISEKNYKCSHCEKTFLTKHRLQNHERTHIKKEKCHKCSYCEKSFSRRDGLASHITTHTGEKSLKCNVCGQCFAQRLSLTCHLRMHNDEKPYTCGVCGKAFRQHAHLRVHEASHLKDKPIECPECGRGFAHKQGLKSHMTTHTQEKSHKCDECGKGFSSKRGLKSHMTTHRGEKSHKCPECGRGFVHKQSLKSHMTTHTGEKSYKCVECGRCFSRLDGLKKHVNTHR